MSSENTKFDKRIGALFCVLCAGFILAIAGIFFGGKQFLVKNKTSVDASKFQNIGISGMAAENPSLPCACEPDYSTSTAVLEKSALSFPILMYHHLGYAAPTDTQSKKDLTVRPEIFEEQMKYLSDQKYTPITFKELVDFYQKEKKTPERSLIISFDDGWASQYEYGFPVLKKYNFPATFFIPTDQIGGIFMSWDQLRELVADGMEIGSHGQSHRNLRGLSDSKLLEEIKGSKKILENALGAQVPSFAYPYGFFDLKAAKVAKDSGYLAARADVYGYDLNSDNMYALKAIQSYGEIREFKKLFP